MLTEIMLRDRDFKEIRLLRDWVWSLVQIFGADEVSSCYVYDYDNLSGAEDLRDLRGFEPVVRKLWGLWLNGKDMYPFERLSSVGRDGLVEDIRGYCECREQRFHSKMSREESLSVLGQLIESTKDEKIKQNYVQLFFEASGFTKGGGVNIDNSSKTVVLDKHMEAAKEIVARYSGDLESSTDV